jgi:hypothetical protein
MEATSYAEGDRFVWRGNDVWVTHVIPGENVGETMVTVAWYSKYGQLRADHFYV